MICTYNIYIIVKINGAWNFKNDSFNGTFAPLKGQRLYQLLAFTPWCRSLEEGLLRWPVEWCPKPLLASVAFSPGRTPIDLINPLTSDPQAGAVGWKLKNGIKIVWIHRFYDSMLGWSIDLQQRLISKWKGIEEETFSLGPCLSTLPFASVRAKPDTRYMYILLWCSWNMRVVMYWYSIDIQVCAGGIRDCFLKLQYDQNISKWSRCNAYVWSFFASLGDVRWLGLFRAYKHIVIAGGLRAIWGWPH